MTNGQNCFDQPVKSDMRTYDNVRKITKDQRDDYTTGFLLDYRYFKENYMSIAIASSKQQAIDADVKAIQQISFTGNLDRPGQTRMFSIIEKANDTTLYFSQGTVRWL